MTIYSKSNTFSANTLIVSANVNQNFDEISTAINTTLCGGTNAVQTSHGGTGLTTVGSAGNFLGISAGVPAWLTPSTNLATSTKTADYTVLATDDLILGSTNAITITLPAATNTGKVVRVVKIGSDTNAVTVSRAGSDTIQGVTSITLVKQYDDVTLVADGSATWYILAIRKAPTIQKFTSGTAQTYTTPTVPNPKYIRVQAVGGGGGGGPGGSSTTAGVDGVDTTFGVLTASAGKGGTYASASGGAGGAASLGSGPIGIATYGNAGGGPSGSSGNNAGGAGGGSCLGGGGQSGYGSGSAGTGGSTNTGGGGGGGGANNAQTGTGGGGGGYVDAIILNPTTTYTYTVGTGGAGGTGATAGGAGAAGIIIVTEYYS